MGYRQVVIRKCYKLRTKDNQLVIEKEKEIKKVPLEDINYILLEDNTCTITGKLISELGNFGICLITCDDKHEPSTIMYPYNHHYKQLEVLEQQLVITEILKEKLWQEIIKAKIKNQIITLERTTKDEKTIKKLYEYYDEVELHDKTNREGLAAKIYFRSLYGSEFIRFYDDAINAALNYAYTIIKSAITRLLAVYGINTYLGIKHKSKTNNFNLCYDLIEPYRAIIDEYIYEYKDSITYPLSSEFRTKLVNLLNKEIICENKKCTIEYSIELLVKSYIKSIKNNRVVLSFPKIVTYE